MCHLAQPIYIVTCVGCGVPGCGITVVGHAVCTDCCAFIILHQIDLDIFYDALRLVVLDPVAQ